MGTGRQVREAGLELLYVGPETGDEATFRRIAKGVGLTLTVIPGTPIAKLAARGGFELPSVVAMLGELSSKAST